ncbi:transcriptional regulator, LacI family [Clostridium sp. USBA 49]|uniref:LacI family DNA-binding transcriptional regulator n=1 Tax=Clostridium sp. USBA 49 TaxID=1881060 RepID=UPI00099A7C67|nr:LacI family DNA-binding transcriptional regulator [Clostridium sp. USBA 49]SKA87316.1 transcriptional regulator, LacI family [Clostridium sp. USBA 49]
MHTIKDVARLANVALSTASYALNGTGKVSQATKEKVLKAAEELGYRPNGAAKDLKRNKKTGIICMFVSDFGGPFYSEVLRGVQDVAICNNYNLIVCTYKMTEKFLNERRVDGAIILSPHIPDDLILKVASPQFPIVVMDRELECENVYTVLLDNVQGAYNATQYLIELGHRNIAYISGPVVSYDNTKRLEGYKKALSDNNIEFNPNLIVQGRFTEEGGYGAAKLLILNSKLNKIPLDAIFCANDEMAIGAINALNEDGINVPEDISIVGYDDIRLSSYIKPSLTTISHYNYEWGTMAANLIFQGLKENSKCGKLILPAKLIKRESCIKSQSKEKFN